MTPTPSPLPAVPSPRLDRENLLMYRAPNGRILPVRTPADWFQRRAEILAGMQAVMGPLPGPEKRVPLAVQCEEEVDCGSYVRRLISYAAEPGARVPAYLLVPKVALSGATRPPGVLCLMGTDNVVGYKNVVGLGGPNVKPGRNYGQELAERGYVVIATPYPLLADYQPPLRELGYQSGTMKGIWDNIRALDVLESLSFVAPGGFGVIGLSLGGHNSIYTAVFDERIKVVVSSCGFDSFLDYMDDSCWQPERGWVQTRYMPRLLEYPRREIPFDFHELVGALAPRAFLANAPLRDANFHWQSVDRVIAAAAKVYELHGVPERLRVEHPDCEHDFPTDSRQSAYAWLDRFLRPGS
ncbi:MAG: alpha/beta hydrolase [Opitutae bacterium]|nr:alpha/beta hydrolase [Opitutae bacterium]